MNFSVFDSVVNELEEAEAKKSAVVNKDAGKQDGTGSYGGSNANDNVHAETKLHGLTIERISIFLRQKEYWKNRDVHVYIYTDGHKLDIVSPEIQGIPQHTQRYEITKRVYDWVSYSITKAKLIDEIHDLAEKCAKRWNLSERKVASSDMYRADGRISYVNTGGNRNEKELSEQQLKMVREYALSLGMPAEKIYYLSNTPTFYGDKLDILGIGTDVFPADVRRSNPNSNISYRGAIAHEIVGHRESALCGRIASTNLLNDVQASIRAAKFAPDLSALERQDLMDDALQRLKRAGLRLEDVEDELFINERGI